MYYDDHAGLAHQEELEHQQWLKEWIDTDDYINHVNSLAYDILSANEPEIYYDV